MVMFSAVLLHGLLLPLILLSTPSTSAWLVVTTASNARLFHSIRFPPSGRATAASWPHHRNNHRDAVDDWCITLAVLPERYHDDDGASQPQQLLLLERHVEEEESLLHPERLPTDDDSTIPIVEDLQRRLRNQQNSTTTHRRLVQVEGYVTAKRAFGSSFCFLDLAQPNGLQQPVQAMLKRQEFRGINNSNDNNSVFFFDGYMKSIVPGIRLKIVGHVAATRNPGEALILIRSMRILGIPRNPQHVRILLQSVADHQLDALEIVHAILASTTVTDVPAAAGMTTTTKNSGARMRWSTAAQLVQTLQEEKQQYTSFEKQPFYRLAKEIVAHLRPLQQGSDSDNEEDEDFVTNLEQSLTSGKKHASSLLPVAGPDICKPPKQASVYANKRQSGFTFDKETRVDSVQTVQEQFSQGKGQSSSITIRAWVQNRRRFQNDITILEATDAIDASHHQGTALPSVDYGRLKCVLHPDVFMLQEKNQTIANVYSQLLAPGSLVLCHGYLSSPPLSSTSLLRPILWVTNVRLLRSCWRPSVICYFLELVVEQQQRKENATAFLDTKEAMQALGISDHKMNDIVSSDLTQRQWAAAEISQNLQQGTPSVAAAARMGTIDPQHMAILESFQGIRRRYPVTPVQVNAPRRERINNNNNKASSSTLEERQGSRWRRKKEPQLEWMTEQVRHVVESHPDYGTRPLRILDIGGGKGLLANRLADALGGSSSVEIHVVDVAHGAVKNGAMRSKRLSLPVQYSVQDASTARIKGEIDVVVALHACGTLSDVALEQAIAHEAGFVICPCCFRSNPHLQIPPRLQNGQPISVQKWLGIHDDAHGDDWNALTSLAEVQGDIQLSQRAIRTICALRADAFNRHSSTQTNKKRPKVHADIKTFPMAYSTRNFCLVGTFS